MGAANVPAGRAASWPPRLRPGRDDRDGKRLSCRGPLPPTRRHAFPAPRAAGAAPGRLARRTGGGGPVSGEAAPDRGAGAAPHGRRRIAQRWARWPGWRHRLPQQAPSAFAPPTTRAAALDRHRQQEQANEGGSKGPLPLGGVQRQGPWRSARRSLAPATGALPQGRRARPGAHGAAPRPEPRVPRSPGLRLRGAGPAADRAAGRGPG